MSLLVKGHFGCATGYGYIAERIVTGLKSLGLPLRVYPAPGIRPPEYMRGYETDNPAEPGHKFELLITTPESVAGFRPTRPYVVYTMWESDRLNPGWIPSLNQASLIIVPCEWCRQVFQDSGVTAPIRCVQLGYNPTIYYQREGPPPVCTFGCAAMLGGGGFRKNVGQLIQNFLDGFPGDNSVRLRIKITPGCSLAPCNDPRVDITRAYISDHQMADWYRSITAFVSTSSAEGFGLHPLEAMACGRPVLTPQYSGVAEFFDGAVGYPLQYQVVPTQSNFYLGKWAQTDPASLIHLMHHVQANPGHAQLLGYQAAARAKNFTWKRCGQKLLRLLAPLLR
jgi:glycosyltransferase involved in cell wall biosynthesis